MDDAVHICLRGLSALPGHDIGGPGPDIAYQTFDMIYDLILIAALIVLIVRARKEQEIERISHEANA